MVYLCSLCHSNDRLLNYIQQLKASIVYSRGRQPLRGVDTPEQHERDQRSLGFGALKKKKKTLTSKAQLNSKENVEKHNKTNVTVKT